MLIQADSRWLVTVLQSQMRQAFRRDRPERETCEYKCRSSEQMVEANLPTFQHNKPVVIKVSTAYSLEQ